MYRSATTAYSRRRARVVPGGRAATWAQRLKRVFAIDIETCRSCDGRLRVIASIEEQATIERILEHLGGNGVSVDPAHPSRAPPRECGLLNGPATRDGSHCDAGWDLYRTDGRTFQGTDVPADFQYYNWVDNWNASGLGANIPWTPGDNSDALLMLDPESGEWLTFRVPYPLGFFQRLIDGRIDDAQADWKGRGLWTNYGTHLAWHIEGGRGTKTKMVKFQFRPDPLAR